MKGSSILIVPSYGDPHGLLKEGPCGYRPPMMYSGNSCGYEYHRQWHDPTVRSQREAEECYMCQSLKWALVLKWRGQIASEGWNRLDDAIVESSLFHPRIGSDRTIATLIRAAKFLECQLIYLDSDGNQIDLNKPNTH